MTPRILNTAADTKYFLQLLNLIGSVHRNARTVRSIVVWDIGLNHMEKKLLRALEGVSINQVPEFVPHWKSCYTWKLFIYENARGDVIFYVDAGSTILGDLEPVFESIEQDGYFAIGQGHELEAMTPPDFWSLFGLSRNDYSAEEAFAAGIFGFLRGALMSKVIEFAFEKSIEGLNLGYSRSEMYRDRYHVGINRDCVFFRHDQTLLNLAFRKFVGTPRLGDERVFARATENDLSGVIILNQRRERISEIPFLQYRREQALPRLVVRLMVTMYKIKRLLKQVIPGA